MIRVAGLLVVLLVVQFAIGAPGTTFPSALSSSQEMVLQKAGTKEYHRPSCEVVRDGKNVLAMTRAQAEARGLKAHADCDPARMPPASSTGVRGSAARVFVFVDAAKPSRGESNQLYHRESCPRLAKERRKLPVDEAGKLYWPCPKCKPPIRQRR